VRITAAVRYLANIRVRSNSYTTLNADCTTTTRQQFSASRSNMVSARHIPVSLSISLTHIQAYLQTYIYRCTHTSTVTGTHRPYTSYTYITHYTLHITSLDAASIARSFSSPSNVYSWRRASPQLASQHPTRHRRWCRIADVRSPFRHRANNSVCRSSLFLARGRRFVAHLPRRQRVVVVVMPAIITDDSPAIPPPQRPALPAASRVSYATKR
jgi:hypothetical protein